MMNTLKEFRAALKFKNQRRFNYLKATFAKSNDQEKRLDENDEVQGLQRVQAILDHEVVAQDERPKQIAISTSEREIWYRDALKTWLTQHPEVGVAPNNNAGLYRFALEFFVNQVVLNPKSTNLSYGHLLEQLKTLNDPDPILGDINFQLETKLEDIKELVSFVSAMEYLENVTSFGPARQLDDIMQSDIRSEFDETSPYADDFAAYQKRRKRDLAGKRKRHNDEGMEFRH